jgi:hypothetical protein
MESRGAVGNTFVPEASRIARGKTETTLIWLRVKNETQSLRLGAVTACGSGEDVINIYQRQYTNIVTWSRRFWNS